MDVRRPPFATLGLALLWTAACGGETVLGETDAPPESDGDTAVAEDVGTDANADADADADADGDEDLGDTVDTPVGVCPGVAPHMSSDCETCRGTRCCWQAQACAADPDCLAWLTCEDACAPTDAVCQRECWTTYRADVMKSAYMACRQRECSGICSGDECSGDYNYFDTPDDGCRACQNLHCCNDLRTCWHDVECVDALECFNSCPDVECMLDECNDAEHQPRLMNLAPIWACRNHYCYAECNDHDDDCSVVFAFTGTCAECVHDNCCPEMTACSNDTECIEYNLCATACDRASDAVACRNDCRARYWRGGGLDEAREYCVRSNCSEICGMPSMTCGGLWYESSACTGCMRENCCAEEEACGTSADCQAVFLCLAGCLGDTTCHANCRRLAPPAGLALYDVEATCRAANCPDSCSAAVVP